MATGPKWTILPAVIKNKMSAAEKKAHASLVKKEREAQAMFHKYEVRHDQASTNKAWKYYAVMFRTIDQGEKMVKKLKAKYS